MCRMHSECSISSMTGPSDDNEQKKPDDAKQKLSEMRGRPFDVDKIIAEHRVREERERVVRKKVEEKLEHEHALARERRHELRAREVEAADTALAEKRQKFEEDKRRFEREEQEKKTVQKPAHPTHDVPKDQGLEA